MTLYVTIGKQAYLSSLVAGKWSSVTPYTRDVEVPSFGLVSLEHGASSVKIPTSPVFGGNFPELPTRQYSIKLSLDGVSLGGKLGLTDLDIRNLKDSSPTGSWGTEATFEVTPTGWQGKTQVSAKLRVVSRDVITTPMKIISASSSLTDSRIYNKPELPEVDTQYILDTFRLASRDSEIPMGMSTARVYVPDDSVTIKDEQT